GERLSAGTADGAFGARISGLLDLETYFLPRPAPGLVYTDGRTLFNPRLSLFLDAQAGDRIYGFAQVRVDRGFDPAKGSLGARFDEYALRMALRRDGRLNFQAGRFASVVGHWIQRHGSWENPFVTAPPAYENLTAI